MAVSYNLLLSITVGTMLTSVCAMKLPFTRDTPIFREYEILYQDKIGQEQRIQTHIHADQPVEDPNGAVVPESCKHTTYCEEVINYPEEAISSLIETLGQGVSLQVDKLDKPDFTQRVSFDENIELCEAQETLVYPRSGIGYDSEQHLLVNGKSDKDKVQGFRVQSCLETECRCNHIVLGYQDGYRGRCKQFYIYRTATAFRMTNSTHAEQYQTHIKLPGYCACMAEPCTDNCDD